jgi:hypothetical protein
MQTEIELMMTPKEVSEAIRVSENTLRAWRVKKRKGRKHVPLPFTKPGGKILYPARAVREFLAANTHTPGEEKTQRKRKRGSSTATPRGSR